LLEDVDLDGREVSPTPQRRRAWLELDGSEVDNVDLCRYYNDDRR